MSRTDQDPQRQLNELREFAHDTYAEAADGTPVSESTLRALYIDRRDLYFYAEAEDERLQSAAQELEPLEKPDIPNDTSLPEQEIRTLVRDEIRRHQ